MDHIFHWIGCFAIIACAVLRMNAMHWKDTPKAEIVAWWVLGVGAFSQFLWVDMTPGWPDTMLVCGTGALLVIHTQPQWRRYIADRRGGELMGEAPRFERRQG